MKNKELALVVSILAVLVVELIIHWYMSTNHCGATVMLKGYLYEDPDTHKDTTILFDITIPTILIGFVTGYVGFEWSQRHLFAYVICIAVVEAALIPVYVSFIGTESAWWWPRTALEWWSMVVLTSAKAFLLTAVMTYGGVLYAMYRHHS